MNNSFYIIFNFSLNQYHWRPSTNFGSYNSCPNSRVPWFSRALVPYYGMWPWSTTRQLPTIPFEFFMHIILLHDRLPLMLGFVVVVLFVLMKCLCVGAGEPGGAGIGAWEGSWGWAEERAARAAGTDAAAATARQGKCWILPNIVLHAIRMRPGILFICVKYLRLFFFQAVFPYTFGSVVFHCNI